MVFFVIYEICCYHLELNCLFSIPGRGATPGGLGPSAAGCCPRANSWLEPVAEEKIRNPFNNAIKYFNTVGTCCTGSPLLTTGTSTFNEAPIKETPIEISNANHFGLKLNTLCTAPQIMYTIPVAPARVAKLPGVKKSCGFIVVRIIMSLDFMRAKVWIEAPA
jgi:hypothetical protein